MEVLLVNLRIDKVQPLQTEVLQVVAFSNVVDLLKAMSLTPHACSKLKSLYYRAITIEFVNCLPTKFNGDILFELPPSHHLLGQLQGMGRKFDGHA
jgi:hypothetical protein